MLDMLLSLGCREGKSDDEYMLEDARSYLITLQITRTRYGRLYLSILKSFFFLKIVLVDFVQITRHSAVEKDRRSG
jgi:hypothetical protein